MKRENISSAIISRLFLAFGIEEKHGANNVLAEKLGVATGSVISNWKTRGVPEKYISKTALDTGTNIEWLLTGEGSPYEKKEYTDTEKQAHANISEHLPKFNGEEITAEEQTVLSIYRRLDEPKKKAFMTTAFAMLDASMKKE